MAEPAKKKGQPARETSTDDSATIGSNPFGHSLGAILSQYCSYCTMVLILDGNSQISVHEWSYPGFLICLRH